MSSDTQHKDIKTALKTLVECESFTFPKEAIQYLLKQLLESKLTDTQATAFLTVTSHPKALLNFTNLYNIVTFILENYINKAVHNLNLPKEIDSYLDVVGTGGDNKSTFNVSTSVSLLISGINGLKVAKHGNYSATSSTNTSSADFIEFILGSKVTQIRPIDIKKMTESDVNYIYLLAGLFLPNLKSIQQLRKQLGFRTIFNMIGPLLNPFRVKRFVIGVYSLELGKIYADLMVKLLGREIKVGYIVCGEIGLDEVSCDGRTHIWKIVADKVDKMTVSPKDFGLQEYDIKEVVTISSHKNAQMFEDIVNKKIESGPIFDYLLMNGALCLLAGGLTDDLATAVEILKKHIHSGAAKDNITKYKEIIKNI